MPVPIQLVAALPVLLLSGFLLFTVRWEGPLAVVEPEELFSAGPLWAGDSVAQKFQSRGAYLSNVRIAVRTEDQGDESDPVGLIFRLYREGKIVREGWVRAEIAPGDIAAVLWEFSPLPDSARVEYELQVVVEEGADRPVFAMTSLTDYLPGGVVTNGFPAAEHIDLSLLPGRSASGIGVLRAVVAFVPAGLAGLVVLAMAVSVSAGPGLAALDGKGVADRRRRTSWIVVAGAVGLMGLAFILHIVALVSAPEARVGFWAVLILFAVALGVAPWLWRYWRALDRAGEAASRKAGGAMIFVAERVPLPDRLQVGIGGVMVRTHRNYGGRGMVFMVAAGLTLVTSVLFVLSEPGFMYIEMHPLEGGRPNPG